MLLTDRVRALELPYYVSWSPAEALEPRLNVFDESVLGN
jgi:hypothetical protein